MAMRLVQPLRNISLLLGVLEAVRGLEEQEVVEVLVLADIEQQPDSPFQPQVVLMVVLHTPFKLVLADLAQALQTLEEGMVG
jgi:hypothetical protein